LDNSIEVGRGVLEELLCFLAFGSSEVDIVVDEDEKTTQGKI
jgi:hypothetical protein